MEKKMKNLIVFFALFTSIANAAPIESASLTTQNKDANARYGVSNYKTVMPGVLFRGGSSTSVRDQKGPLSGSSQEALCNDGFDSAVYGYSTGWKGGDKSVNCAGGQLTYTMKRWDRPADLREVLKTVRDIIVEKKGAMYVHCYFGVHASGYIVTTALMQFCGLSASEGVAYWNSNVAKSIQYEKVQKMIRSFQPYSDLTISAADQARVCPSGL